MKNFFEKSIYSLVNHLPIKKTIIFESAPSYSDNTKAVFDEMVRRGLNKKYLLVWHIFEKDRNCFIDGDNITYITKWDNKARWYYARAKALVFCNRLLPKLLDDQKSFNLTHGSALKDTTYYSFPHYIDYCICPSNNISPLLARIANYPENRIIPLGYPRNDILTSTKQADLSKLFGYYKKYVVWYPTFRQHNCGLDLCDLKNALPIINDAELARKLNSCAAKNNVLIILKPHFAQDTSYIKDLGLGNIRFINDLFFTENNISSYEFIAATDALLSDYSSIYHDYTLCDKPIGLVWEDIEEYKKKPGLIKEYEYICQGGVKIYTIDDLCNFVEDVANDIDRLKKERNEICDWLNYSRDGKNTERVVDFIIEKAGL